jgi:hypothetical protein
MSQTRPFEILLVVVFSLNPLKDKSCQRARFNDWRIEPCIRLWPMLIGLPLASAINIHYEILVKYLKLHLTSSPNYSWFMQYMENDNGDGRITPLPLGMHFELQHLENN